MALAGAAENKEIIVISDDSDSDANEVSILEADRLEQKTAAIKAKILLMKQRDPLIIVNELVKFAMDNFAGHTFNTRNKIGQECDQFLTDLLGSPTHVQFIAAVMCCQDINIAPASIFAYGDLQHVFAPTSEHRFSIQSFKPIGLLDAVMDMITKMKNETPDIWAKRTSIIVANHNRRIQVFGLKRRIHTIVWPSVSDPPCLENDAQALVEAIVLEILLCKNVAELPYEWDSE
jgi:hypothetical protein